MSELDAIDLKILETLQQGCRLTTKELAAKVNLSPTPVFERQKRLEKEGYIKKYIAILDADKLHQGFVVFCYVKLHQLNRQTADEFMQSIRAIDSVRECYNISGEYDYLLRIQAADMKSYQDLIYNRLGVIGSVSGLQSVFVMDQVKQEFGVPLQGAQEPAK